MFQSIFTLIQTVFSVPAEYNVIISFFSLAICLFMASIPFIVVWFLIKLICWF